jgi:hypothetical protein
MIVETERYPSRGRARYRATGKTVIGRFRPDSPPEFASANGVGLIGLPLLPGRWRAFWTLAVRTGGLS